MMMRRGVVVFLLLLYDSWNDMGFSSCPGNGERGKEGRERG